MKLGPKDLQSLLFSYISGYYVYMTICPVTVLNTVYCIFLIMSQSSMPDKFQGLLHANGTKTLCGVFHKDCVVCEF
jgi:hypothetical protein